MNLADRMEAGELVLEPLAERHRDDLRAACAEDPGIWTIYATPYGPEHFDRSFDLLLSRPTWACFAIVRAGRLIGMSCFIGIDQGRGVLEIGNTYYVPGLRGTGFNRRVKDLMIRRAIESGFRRIEFRVDGRNRRSQAAMPGGWAMTSVCATVVMGRPTAGFRRPSSCGRAARAPAWAGPV